MKAQVIYNYQSLYDFNNIQIQYFNFRKFSYYKNSNQTISNYNKIINQLLFINYSKFFIKLTKILFNLQFINIIYIYL